MGALASPFRRGEAGQVICTTAMPNTYFWDKPFDVGGIELKNIPLKLPKSPDKTTPTDTGQKGLSREQRSRM